MKGPGEFCVTGRLASYDRTDRIQEINLPTLFTCGRYDGATPEATTEYHRLLPGSEIAVFEQRSHMPHLEETERYLQFVREFLYRAEAQ